MKVTVEFDTEILGHRELLKEWLEYGEQAAKPEPDLTTTADLCGSGPEPVPEVEPTVTHVPERPFQTREELLAATNEAAMDAYGKHPKEAESIATSLREKFGKADLKDWTDEQLRIGLTEMQAILRF